MAIHIDEDGNLYFGASGTVDFDNITYVPDFSVTNTGVLTAKSGTIGGITLNASDIQANYTSGSAGFKIDTNGDAEFNEIKLRVKGNQNDISPSGVSDAFIAIGDSFVYDYAGDLTLQGNTIRIKAQDDDANDPSLTFQVSFDNPGFYAVSDGQNTQAKLYWSNGNANIIHTESDAQTLYIDATQISIGGTTGGNSTYIGKNSSGTLGWHSLPSGGGSHSDSDHTSFVNHVDTSSGGGGGTDALTISGTGIRLNFGTTSTRVAVGNHDHDSDYITGISTSGSGPFISSASGSTITRTSSGANTGSIYPGSSYSGPINGVYYGSDLGTSSKRYANLNVGNVNEYSDENSKNTIEDAVLGLDFINALRPVSYKYNQTNDYTGTDEDGAPTGSKAGVRKHYGFIAQEVKQVLDDMSVSDEDFAGHVADYGAGESLRYREIFITAIKAIQELSTQISDLTARIEVLEG